MKREITSLYQFFEAFPDEQAAIDHLTEKKAKPKGAKKLDKKG